MSHADVLVCDGDQHQEAGPSFYNMEVLSCVDLLSMYRLVDPRNIISSGQKREMECTTYFCVYLFRCI